MNSRQDGDNNSNSKLDWDSVAEIRKLNKQGVNYLDLSNKFSVSKCAIGKVCRHENWIPNTGEEKQCGMCHKTLPSDKFRKNRRTCTPCMIARQKEYNKAAKDNHEFNALSQKWLSVPIVPASGEINA